MQAFRFCATLLIYIGELLFLLYSVQLLVESSLGFRPFSVLTEFKLVKPFFNLLWSFPPVQRINSVVEQIVPKVSRSTAAGELIGAIGVGGVFVTMLTGTAEQRICGVRTGELLNWLHTGFFWAYALLFLPLVLLGVYAGHARKGDAAIYAFFGVFLGLLLALWAFYELVLSANEREKLALQYYARQIRPGITHTRRRQRRSPDDLAARGDAHRAMLSVADYLREQAEYYHRNISAEMIRLWIFSCPVPFEEDVSCPDCGAVDGGGLTARPARMEPDLCRITRRKDGEDRFESLTDGGFRYPDSYLSNGQDCIIGCSILARDIWAALLPEDDDIKRDLDLTIIRQLLCSLYQVSEPDKRRFVVLLGLLFCLEDKAENDDARLIGWVDEITKESAVPDYDSRVPRQARYDLAWALLMIRVVAWIQNGTVAEHSDSIPWFCHCFGNEFYRCGAQPDVCDRQESALLWYAEWAARKRRELSLTRYLVGISTIIGMEVLYPYFWPDILTYRKQALTNVLTLNYPWSDEQDEKEGLSGNA